MAQASAGPFLFGKACVIMSPLRLVLWHATVPPSFTNASLSNGSNPPEDAARIARRGGSALTRMLAQYLRRKTHLPLKGGSVGASAPLPGWEELKSSPLLRRGSLKAHGGWIRFLMETCGVWMFGNWWPVIGATSCAAVFVCLLGLTACHCRSSAGCGVVRA